VISVWRSALRREVASALANRPITMIATYVTAGHGLLEELRGIIDKADRLEFFDHAGGRAAWQGFLTRLEAVDRDLAVVAGDREFSLELCLACWERDWNRNGRIDEADRKLFELEFDGKGGELAEGDPRRRPTFRFDTGDAEWARAMIAFQRAAGELVLAYQWSDRADRSRPRIARIAREHVAGLPGRVLELARRQGCHRRRAGLSPLRRRPRRNRGTAGHHRPGDDHEHEPALHDAQRYATSSAKHARSRAVHAPNHDLMRHAQPRSRIVGLPRPGLRMWKRRTPAR